MISVAFRAIGSHVLKLIIGFTLRSQRVTHIIEKCDSH